MKSKHPRIAQYMEVVKAATQPHYEEVFKKMSQAKKLLEEKVAPMDAFSIDMVWKVQAFFFLK